MPTDILTISIDRTTDPDGEQLRGLIDAELAYERARTARQRWLSVLAVGALIALIAHARGVDGDAAWASALSAAVLAAIAMRAALAALAAQRSYRRWSAALSLHPGAVLRGAPED
jgi:hypothetical protein